MYDERFAQFERLLETAGKSIQRLKSSRMDAFSLSAAHTDCLSLLASAPDGLTQMQLADTLRMDRAQVSRVLRDLCGRAYVLTGAAGYKRRYRLTEAGLCVAQEIARTVAEVRNYVSGGIPTGDLDAFYRIFGILAARLSQAVALYGPAQRSPASRGENGEATLGTGDQED